MNIRFEGLDPILAKLDALAKVPKRRDIFQAIGDDIVAEVSPYPPASEANRPPPPYYVRGFGTIHATYQEATSQNLSTKWFIRPSDSFVDVGNTATYAPYVHGEQQEHHHTARGWKQLKQRAEAIRPKIIAGIEKFVNQIVSSRA